MVCIHALDQWYSEYTYDTFHLRKLLPYSARMVLDGPNDGYMLHSATENIDTHTHKQQQRIRLSFSPSRLEAIAMHESSVNRAVSVVFSIRRLLNGSLTAAFGKVVDFSVGSRDDLIVLLSFGSRSTTTY